MFRFAFLSIALMIISGCQTAGYVIENSNYSVKQHRIAIVGALGNPKTISENGRVITTHYHNRSLQNLEVTTKTKERLYTKVSILGSRRPFKVSIEVHIEKRDPESKKFQDVGLDDRLGRRRALEIKEALNQSPEEDGLFDEEAPF